MFSTLRSFLNRHKRKFIVASVVIGGSTLAMNFAHRKLREWQERETRNLLDMTKKKQHFESTERTCNQTIISLAPSVCEAVSKALDTRRILNLLRGNPDNKVELWQDLKILTFAKVTSVVYAFTILVVTLRIQLNIIGGYMYKGSIKQDATLVITEDIQQKFLSLCHYFVSEGVEKLCKQIESTVRTIIEPLPLKQKLSLKDTEKLFWSIQTALCTDSADPLKQMITYLIEDTSTCNEDLLKRLLNETMDLMESDEVKSLSISNVSKGFTLVMDQIAESFSPPPNEGLSIVELDSQQQTSRSSVDKSQLNSYIDVNKVELPLAKLIPIINGLISQPLGRGLSGIPEATMQQLIFNDKLKIMGANIYEVFCC